MDEKQRVIFEDLVNLSPYSRTELVKKLGNFKKNYGIFGYTYQLDRETVEGLGVNSKGMKILGFDPKPSKVYNKKNIETEIAAEAKQPETKTLDIVVENIAPEEPMKTEPSIEATITPAPVEVKKPNGLGSRENPIPFDQT